jgi:drug/metabolite transporter (DMT)-like permease
MKTKALTALIVGAVLIGFVPLGVHLSEVPPLATGFWRFVLTIPLWALLSRHTPSSGTVRPVLLIAAGLAFAGDIGCYFLSIRASTAANATLLSNAAPIVVLIVAFLLWRERPRSLAVLGTILAMVGVICLVMEGTQLGRGRLIGDVLGLVSAVFYGTYQLIISRLRNNQSAARIMLWVGGVGALILGVWAVLAGEPLFPQTWYGWMVLISMALVTQVGGQGLITWSLAHLPATFSSVVLMVQPLVAAVIGVLIMHEPFTVWLAMGGSLILLGIFLASRRN